MPARVQGVRTEAPGANPVLAAAAAAAALPAAADQMRRLPGTHVQRAPL